MSGRDFKAVEPLAHIGEKTRLGEFAVGDDIDAAIDLLAHDVGDRTRSAC